MKNTQIKKFLSAQMISLFGSSLVQYAIIWYITLTTSSGSMMTLATICGYLPQIIISLFAGVWCDRYNRKILIMLSDGMIAFATCIVMVIFFMGMGTVWWLFAVLMIRSIGTGIQTPAVNAYLPQIAENEELMKVNGIMNTCTSIMMFLTPACSGALLSFLSMESIFIIDIITAVIANIIMISIHAKHHLQPQKETMITSIKQGFQFMQTQHLIRNFLIYLMFVMIFISPAAFLTPLLVSRTFGSEVYRLTISEMTFSLGAIMGGVLITTWGGFKNRLHTIFLMTILYGVFMFGIGISSTYVCYLLCNFLIGITMPCFNTPLQVFIQEQVTPIMHGRIFSLLQIVNACSLPLGTMLFGPLADRISVSSIFMICAIFVIIYGMIGFMKLKVPRRKS